MIGVLWCFFIGKAKWRQQEATPSLLQQEFTGKQSVFTKITAMPEQEGMREQKTDTIMLQG